MREETHNVDLRDATKTIEQDVAEIRPLELSVVIRGLLITGVS